jgi:hypothetical protein
MYITWNMNLKTDVKPKSKMPMRQENRKTG